MKQFLLVTIMSALIAIPAMADPIWPTSPVVFGPGTAGELSLQGVLDSITTLPNLGNSSVDTTQDAITDGVDAYWNISGSGQSAATMIIELSAWSGTTSFGLYDAVTGAKAQVFAGTDAPGFGPGTATVAITNPGPGVFNVYVDEVFKAAFGGDTFGFYITTPGNTWFSDTALNSDTKDHMLAYQGQNVDTIKIADLTAGLWTDGEYVLGWEDQANLGDGDWQDIVVMVESVAPVPVPAAVLLGMLGLGAAGIRLRKHV